MNETLYMKLEQNPSVTAEPVSIGDISATWCKDKKVLQACRSVPVKLNPSIRGKSRTIYSAMDLVQMIQEKVENVEVTVLGEEDLIISMAPQSKSAVWIEWTKVVLIAVIIFLGSAFAIMTFNNDVGVKPVFGDIYQWMMGEPSDGFTLLEQSYSIGVGLGILVFYNHFRRKNRIADPTPLEVEMRQYETNINEAILQEDARMQKHQNGTQSAGGNR